MILSLNMHCCISVLPVMFSLTMNVLILLILLMPIGCNVVVYFDINNELWLSTEC